MKTLKFLFIAVILACFVGIAQTNAQAVITRWEHTPDWPKEVYYEVDGVPITGHAIGDILWILNPSRFIWVFHGVLMDEGNPLPKKTVIYYDPNFNNEKVTITPTGFVTVIVSWQRNL